MLEIWKPIDDFDEYEVSNLGNVRRKGKQTLKLTVSTGYVRITLRKGGKSYKKYVHRLVADAFIPKTDTDKVQVNHIDGNKLNSKVCNLEWVTCSENHLHAYAMGLKDPKTACPKVGNGKGISSKYKYVTYFRNEKEEKYVATITEKKVTKSRSFSVKKYGKEKAEYLAALAVNELIETFPIFSNRPKNIVENL
jgi:hypothetical protein